jgi:hypothetical protein
MTAAMTGQLNSFTHIRALLVLHDRGIIIIIINGTGTNDNKHAYAGQLNSFTHIRALLVLYDRGNDRSTE